MAYKFKCKQCGHEYVHDFEHIRKCPECGTENQTSGKFGN